MPRVSSHGTPSSSDQWRAFKTLLSNWGTVPASFVSHDAVNRPLLMELGTEPARTIPHRKKRAVTTY